MTATLVAAGCGGSSQSSADKAKSTACAASADVKTQVAKLTGMTVGTASVDAVKKSLQAMSADLKTIKAQTPEIKGALKQQLQHGQRGVQDRPAAGVVEHHVRRIAVRCGHGAHDCGRDPLGELRQGVREPELLTRGRAARAIRAAPAGGPAHAHA